MTKNEFLKNLKDGLKGFSNEEIKEILEDYTSHIREAVENGRSEEESVKALGDVNEIIKEYRVNKAIEKFESDKNPKNFVKMVLIITGLSLVNIIFLLGPMLTTFSILFATTIAGITGFISGIYLALANYVPSINANINYTFVPFLKDTNTTAVGIVIALIGFMITWASYKLTRLFGNLVFKYLKLNKKIAMGK